MIENKYNPEGSVLRNCQLRMLEMLEYIDSVCREKQIAYWIASGTLLGAVRYGGFIPWDDDVDIEVMREDFEPLMAALAESLPNDMVVQTYKTDKDFLFSFGKVRCKRMQMKENYKVSMYYKYHGISVDIFPLEQNTFILSEIGKWMQKGNTYIARLPDSPLELKRYLMRFVYGFLNSLIYPIFRCISNWKYSDTLRSALGFVYNSPRSRKDLFPLSSISFEGKQFPAPGNVKSYLTRIYGTDYMTPPPENQIETHASDFYSINN